MSKTQNNKTKNIFTFTKEFLENANIRINVILLFVGISGLVGFVVKGTTIYNEMRANISTMQKDVTKMATDTEKIEDKFVERFDKIETRIQTLEMQMIQVKTHLKID